MELYAAGFNAWNQLLFPPLPPQCETEPDDLHVFTKVLTGGDIERPRATLSYTTVRRDKVVCRAGLGVGTDYDDTISLYAETANGEILVVQANHLVRYPSREACAAHADGQTWPCKKSVKQITAYEVGFVILHHDGSVATLGDPRFDACLGRDVAEESPAVEPCPVSDLDGLDGPVKRIAAGGYVAAALTQGGSLYVWGTSTTGTHRRQQAFSYISGTPDYIEVDGGKDVQDVAVGESHAIVLTTDGCLYVIGGNHNSQLGLGRDEERVESWTKLDFHPSLDFEAVGIATGSRVSFILTSRKRVET